MNAKIFLKTFMFNILEERKVRRLFYSHRTFRKVERLLKDLYYLDNPYRIAHSFHFDQNYYGETPLSVMHRILEGFGCRSDDYFYDIGSGRGRLCFFVEAIFGCRVFGVELVPLFVERAEKIAAQLSLRSIFYQENFKQSQFKGASFIYLYGTCMNDEEIEHLCKTFKNLEKEVKIVTVSYPLSDYDEAFEVVKRIEEEYPWGRAHIFLNQVRREK